MSAPLESVYDAADLCLTYSTQPNLTTRGARFWVTCDCCGAIAGVPEDEFRRFQDALIRDGRAPPLRHFGDLVHADDCWTLERVARAEAED